MSDRIRERALVLACLVPHDRREAMQRECERSLRETRREALADGLRAALIAIRNHSKATTAEAVEVAFSRLAESEET